VIWYAWCLSYHPNSVTQIKTSDWAKRTACSVGWWLMAGAGLFWEKSTAGWLRVAVLFWEKRYCWLVADKPSEQGGRPVARGLGRRVDPFWCPPRTPEGCGGLAPTVQIIYCLGFLLGDYIFCKPSYDFVTRLLIQWRFASWYLWFFPFTSGGFSTLNLVSPCDWLVCSSSFIRHSFLTHGAHKHTT
jgi:hypothetical protein